MGIIKILDESVSNMIAAGEVVENPASMIKELLENSLDAESKNITIDIKNGGRSVTIKDDGKGMSKDDVLMSVERHATSKISSKEDLFKLMSYGFRGEALSSIAGVSKLAISSKDADSPQGTHMTVLGGKVTSIKDIQMNKGTTIEIKDLFFNTPARLKFLRKSNTEYSNIKDIVLREALANDKVGITLILDNKISIKTSGNSIDNAIVEIFSKNTLKNCKKFTYGYLGNSALFRNNRDSIFIFVNGRTVRSKIIENAVIDGYYTKLMKGKFPFALIFLDVDPKDVDVNVHPSKKIVKFSNDINIYTKVMTEVKAAISNDDVFISPTIINDSSLLENTENDTPNELSLLNISTFDTIKSSSQELDLNYNNENKISTSDKVVERSYSIINDFFSKQYSESSYNEINELEKSGSEAGSYFQSKEDIYLTEDKDDKKIDQPQKTTKLIHKVYDFKVLGQIFDTFILVERNGIFEIYDQHIVHERILYETLKKEFYNKSINKQLLLMPIKIDIDPRDCDLIKENLQIFNDFGFEADIWDDNQLLLRSVPVFDFRDSHENIFNEILNNIKEKKNIDIRENIIISMSCKGAIKANEKLTIEQMTDIIDKLLQLKEFTCPHGRPIMIKITLSDLEKLFKRKL